MAVYEMARTKVYIWLFNSDWPVTLYFCTKDLDALSSMFID